MHTKTILIIFTSNFYAPKFKENLQTLAWSCTNRLTFHLHVQNRILHIIFALFSLFQAPHLVTNSRISQLPAYAIHLLTGPSNCCLHTAAQGSFLNGKADSATPCLNFFLWLSIYSPDYSTSMLGTEPRALSYMQGRHSTSELHTCLIPWLFIHCKCAAVAINCKHYKECKGMHVWKPWDKKKTQMIILRSSSVSHWSLLTLGMAGIYDVKLHTTDRSFPALDEGHSSASSSSLDFILNKVLLLLHLSWQSYPICVPYWSLFLLSCPLVCKLHDKGSASFHCPVTRVHHSFQHRTGT